MFISLFRSGSAAATLRHLGGGPPRGSDDTVYVVGKSIWILIATKISIPQLACLPKRGPELELVPASNMELRHGQEIEA